MLVQVRLPGLSTAHVGLSPPFYWLSVGASVLAISTGLGLIFDPTTTSRTFGLPIKHGKSGKGYAATTGVRNVVLGISTLYFAQANDRRAVAISVISGAALALSNGIIVWHFGEQEERQTAATRHLIGATLSAVFAVVLVV